MLKKELTTTRVQVEDYIAEISKLENQINTTANNVPSLKQEISRLTSVNVEMDINAVRLRTLLDAKEGEVAEMRAYQSQLSGTAQRWLGLDSEHFQEMPSSLSSSSSLSTTSSPSKLEGMPSSLVEFMAKVAASPTSSMTSTASPSATLHPASPSTASSSASTQSDSPSTPQAAHHILQQWVGNNSTSMTGSPSSLMGTPRRVRSSGSTCSTGSTNSINNSTNTTMSSILKHEGHATKLALRLARLEEQNRSLVNQRQSIDDQSKTTISKLEQAVQTASSASAVLEKKVISLEANNNKLKRNYTDVQATLKRINAANDTTKEKKKTEIQGLQSTLKDLRQELTVKEEELDKVRENMTRLKMEHRSAVSDLRGEYDVLETTHRATLSSLQVFEETETHRREQTEHALKRKTDEVSRLREEIR